MEMQVVPAVSSAVQGRWVGVARGTRIGTPRGERLVEALSPGDPVLLGNGRTARVARVSRRAPARPADEGAPIRIRANALGPGLPRHDLLVAPDHAIEVNGLLVQAGLLANGATIKTEKRAAAIEYLQPEVESDGAFLAEGVPASGAGPRRMAEAAVAACKRRLRDRALELGHKLTSDPILHLLADGQMLHPVEIKDLRYTFLIDRQTGQVRLRSRASIASEVLPVADGRRLGVAVRRIVLNGVSNALVLLPGGKAPPGFYPVEDDGEGARRWTSGDALLPQACIDAVGAPCRLDVYIAATVPYWMPPPSRPLV